MSKALEPRRYGRGKGRERMEFPGPLCASVSQPLQPLGSRGGTEVFIFHSVILSADVIESLLYAQNPGRHWGPKSDVDSHSTDLPVGSLGRGWMYTWSNCKCAAKEMSRRLRQATAGRPPLHSPRDQGGLRGAVCESVSGTASCTTPFLAAGSYHHQKQLQVTITTGQ